MRPPVTATASAIGVARVDRDDLAVHENQVGRRLRAGRRRRRSTRRRPQRTDHHSADTRTTRHRHTSRLAAPGIVSQTWPGPRSTRRSNPIAVTTNAGCSDVEARLESRTGPARASPRATPVLDTLSQLLLGVRWVVFDQGELRFAPPAGATLAALLAVGAVAAAVVTYRRAPRRLSTRDRWVLTALRTALIGLLLAVPVPPDARAARGRAAPERRGRAARRLAQHAHRGPERAAAQHLRAAGVRRGRRAACARRSARSSPCARCASPAALGAGADRRGPDVCRHQHPAGGGARRGAPAAGRRAAGRPGGRERRRRHERRGPGARRCSRSRRRACRCSPSASGATPPSATSRWAASPRRAPCWPARRCCSMRW